MAFYLLIDWLYYILFCWWSFSYTNILLEYVLGPGATKLVFLLWINNIISVLFVCVHVEEAIRPGTSSLSVPPLWNVRNVVFTEWTALNRLSTLNRTYLHGFHPYTLYIPPLQCHPAVLIMSVFDLQLSLSQRDPSQRESLPTTPCCVFKSEAEAATVREKERKKWGSRVQTREWETEDMEGKWSKCVPFRKSSFTEGEKYETNMSNNIQI